MSRPLRIEYAGAWYHVSNRGAGRQRVFRNDAQRDTFLALLGELTTRFEVAVHAYCLMSNRYDLVLQTSLPNLALAMRHLNGIYTQYYNRTMARDGALFRGRYRAVLFDPESCLLGVSRHLHRRPLVTGNVPRLDRYRWSSYPSYVTRRKRPAWLSKEVIESQAAAMTEHRGYRQFVEREGQGIPLVAAFYRARRPGVILGPPAFRDAVLRRAAGVQSEAPGYQRRPAGPTVDTILAAVAAHYGTDRRSLLASRRGRLNLPRLAAIWLCRHRGHLSLKEVADRFGLAAYGSASATLHRVRTEMQPAFWRHVRAIEADLAAIADGSGTGDA